MNHTYLTDAKRPFQYPSGWWIVAFSNEVPLRKPVGLKRFGRDLVFWRSPEGEPRALDDTCPHRSVKLSLGRLRGDCLECPFHGFRFAAHGECVLIPETGKVAPGIRVRSYAVREQDGYLWLWWPGSDFSAEVQGLPPHFEEVRREKFSVCNYSMVQACHATRAIENQLDTAHLAFIHATTIGRGADPKSKKRVVTTENEIKIDLGSATDQIPYIRLKLPNYWINAIHPRFMATLAFAPVDDGHVRLYMRTHQRFIVFPILGKLITWFTNLFNQIVLQQDKRVVVSHPAGSSLELGVEEQLIGSDLAIREFRKIWAKNLEKNPSQPQS